MCKLFEGNKVSNARQQSTKITKKLTNRSNSIRTIIWLHELAAMIIMMPAYLILLLIL